MSSYLPPQFKYMILYTITCSKNIVFRNIKNVSFTYCGHSQALIIDNFIVFREDVRLDRGES